MTNYILTGDFLFTSKSCTTIRFEVSDKISVYEEFNSRTKVVKYIDGSTYSQLNFQGFTSYTDNLIIPGVYNLRECTSTIINGVEYYVSSSYDFISCFITPDMNEILVTDKTINILTDGTLTSYKRLLNSTAIIKTNKLDDLSIVSNFNCINLNLPYNKNFSNNYLHEFSEFSINDSMIVSAFVDALNIKLPNYTIAPELNKEFIRDQKQNILIYEAKLTEHSGDYITHVRYRPDMGRYAQTETEVVLEILTDDFETYMNTRDQLMMNKHLFSLTTFILTDKYSREWSYSCNWSMNELGSEIDRNPKSKYFDETILYSIQLTVRLIGWLVEKFNIHSARIQDPVVLTYVKPMTSSTKLNKSFIIDSELETIDISLESIIDLEHTKLYYKIGNIVYLGKLYPITNEFEIVIDSGHKYTGTIDPLSGTFYFNPRPDNKFMDYGELIIHSQLAVMWSTNYNIVAEIIPDDNTYLISGMNDYIITQDGRRVVTKFSIEYINTEFRYVYYGYVSVGRDKGYHIFSINPNLLDSIKSNFDSLYRENQSTIIVSSGNQVKGYDLSGNMLSSITWSSGNSKFVKNYLEYNLFNYSRNKFIKLKELKS